MKAYTETSASATARAAAAQLKARIDCMNRVAQELGGAVIFVLPAPPAPPVKR